MSIERVGYTPLSFFNVTLNEGGYRVKIACDFSAGLKPFLQDLITIAHLKYSRVVVRFIKIITNLFIH